MSLPRNPAPSSVEIEFSGLGVKARSSNKKRSQNRRSNLFNFGFSLSYSNLDKDQRDILNGFFLEEGLSTFRAYIPTYSDNETVLSETLTLTQGYVKGDKNIEFENIIGEFKPMNMIRVSGSDLVHIITSVQAKSGNNQTVNIQPPLNQDVTGITVFETKDVEVNVSIDDDSFGAGTEGVTSDFSIKISQDLD